MKFLYDMYFILKNHVTKCPINSKRKNEMDIIYIYINGYSVIICVLRRERSCEIGDDIVFKRTHLDFRYR